MATVVVSPFTSSGCNTKRLGSGEGYANGNFPDATQVLKGTITMSVQTPTGTTDTNSTWIGQKRLVGLGPTNETGPSETPLDSSEYSVELGKV